jgi:hypothetical protein
MGCEPEHVSVLESNACVRCGEVLFEHPFRVGGVIGCVGTTAPRNPTYYDTVRSMTDNPAVLRAVDQAEAHPNLRLPYPGRSERPRPAGGPVMLPDYFDDPAVTSERRAKFAAGLRRRARADRAARPLGWFQVAAVAVAVVVILLDLSTPWWVGCLIAVAALLGGRLLVDWARRAPSTPDWDRVSYYAMTDDSKRLMLGAVDAAAQAAAAARRGIPGVLTGEVDRAVRADVWRVATLCRDADGDCSGAPLTTAQMNRREETHRVAAQTVKALRAFAGRAADAADAVSAGNLDREDRLATAREQPPESTYLADILAPEDR